MARNSRIEKDMPTSEEFWDLAGRSEESRIKKG
jgi:hypothetical protein